MLKVVSNLRSCDGEGDEVEGEDGVERGLGARARGERVDDRLVPTHQIYKHWVRVTDGAYADPRNKCARVE